MKQHATPRPLSLGILGCVNIAKQFVRDVAPSPHAITFSYLAAQHALAKVSWV